MKLFQYVVIYNPDLNKEKNKSKEAKLLVNVTNVLASSFETAKVLAARSIPEQYLDRLDEVEVAVRPF